MRKLWTIILLCLILPQVISAAALDDIRWEVYSQMNLSTSGVERLADSVMDTLVSRGIKQVSADFLVDVNDTTIDLARDTSSYALPSDFLEMPDRMTILWCLRFESDPMGDTITVPIPIVPSTQVFQATIAREQSPKPQATDYSRYIWAFDSSLYVWPKPRNNDDSLWVGYMAWNDASTMSVLVAHRERLIEWLCWHAYLRLKMYKDAAVWESLYRKSLQ